MVHAGLVLARNQPLPSRPRLTQVAVTPTNLLLTAADLTPGLTHQLQMSASLAPVDWSVRLSFLATGYSAVIADSATNGSGFYRLAIP